MKSTLATFLAVTMLALGFAAPGYANFSGAYTLPWTQTAGLGGTGGTQVDTSGAPNILQFLGGDSGCQFSDCLVRYSVTVAGTGSITFDWETSTDDECCEIFGYGVNNILNPLWNAGPDGPAGGGSESIPVALGDTFEFWYDCTDCGFGPGQASIRNFNGPGRDGSVPEPATLALLGISLMGLGVSRLRRRRI